MTAFFKILTSAISLFAFLCFIRVILTWVPSLSYSRFAQVLAQLCDPYLNFFRRFPLRIGALDFSAMLAFAVLMLLSSITGNLAMGRAITAGTFLAMVLRMIGEIISSLLTLLIVFLIVRLIVFYMKADRGYSNIWTQIDYSLNPFIFKISGLFSGRRPMNFQTSLIISIVCIFLTKAALKYLTAILCNILVSLPI